MLAMQYSIQLPPNYGSDKIRERVGIRSKLFDGHHGLLHKAFLYNEAEQLYAPFYVWKDVTEAREFLFDDLFKGVIEAFSRHRVRSWFVVQAAHGNRAVRPTYCLRELDIIPAEQRLDQFLAHEQQEQQALLANPHLYMHLVALDADRWELLRYSLWADKKSAGKSYSDSYLEYEVLHVSEPNS